MGALGSVLALTNGKDLDVTKRPGKLMEKWAEIIAAAPLGDPAKQRFIAKWNNQEKKSLMLISNSVINTNANSLIPGSKRKKMIQTDMTETIHVKLLVKFLKEWRNGQKFSTETVSKPSENFNSTIE